MLKSVLLEIITNGENSGVEFKRDDCRPEQLAKEIAAMSNLNGGMVLLGVEDDGCISGIQRPDLENWVMDTTFVGMYIHWCCRFMKLFRWMTANGWPMDLSKNLRW